VNGVCVREQKHKKNMTRQPTIVLTNKKLSVCLLNQLIQILKDRVGLHFINCTIENENDFIKFIRLLPRFPLTVLNVSDMSLSRACWMEITKVVHQSKTIINFDVGADDLTEHDINACIASVVNGTVTSFTLKYNITRMTNMDTLKLALMDPKCNLLRLQLSGCALIGIEGFFLALSYTSIHSITLDYCYLNDKAMINLSSVLNQTKIRCLYLKRNNQITDNGIRWLSSAIRKSNILTTVDLSLNFRLTNKSVDYLMDALIGHPSIQHINVYNCGGIDLKKTEELCLTVKALHSDRAILMTRLCWYRTLKECPLNVLPTELFRTIADTLHPIIDFFS